MNNCKELGKCSECEKPVYDNFENGGYIKICGTYAHAHCAEVYGLKGEIATLKARLQITEAERDAAVQVIYSCPICTNCMHMDECDEIGGRCEGRGYGGDCHEPNDEPHFKWRGLTQEP